MNDTMTATVRTTVNATVLAALAWLGTEVFDWNLDITNPAIIALVAAVVGVGYRLSVLISEKVPALGYVLFGVRKEPYYEPLPAPTPPPEFP